MQSSVALLEKQRNPGVGYWASRNESTSELRSPRSSVSDLARETPSRPSTPTATKSDEEVNFEYLRNIIMQFLEHKEMRVSTHSHISCVECRLTYINSRTLCAFCRRYCISLHRRPGGSFQKSNSCSCSTHSLHTLHPILYHTPRCTSDITTVSTHL